MTRAYLISTTTALALGLTGGFVANSITASATVPHNLEAIAVKDLAPGSSNTVDTVLVNQLCDDARAKLGTDECAAELFKVKGFRGVWVAEYEDENGDTILAHWQLRAPVRADGTFTAGEAQ